MSKLSIDQKRIQDLLSDKKSDFLIPDYQRPYAWTEDECDTLWDDLFGFCFPNNDFEAFDTNSEYFLGPIVTFKNENHKLEIIDGQQRLTTILLLLRAFYDKFQLMQDKQSKSIREKISHCVWKCDEFDEPDMDQLKIDSQVASDNVKDEFLNILRTGTVSPGWKSNYAKNFRFFQGKIQELVNTFPPFTTYFAARILQNVILLPIEAESQDTALRIFSTLNDRGLPLSDADIFKSKFYSFYSKLGKKDEFIKRWKQLEVLTEEIFASSRSAPMVELFTRYMYYARAKLRVKDTTTPALRLFFEGGNNYKSLNDESVFNELESLANFWKRLYRPDEFSDKTKKQLFILQYAPNGMWTYLTSVYFLARKDKNDNIDEEAFNQFLDKITAFIIAYAVIRPGVNALRTPVYPEMVNLVTGMDVKFENHKFSKDIINNALKSFSFTNGRPVTRSMLTWWAMQNPDQIVLDKFTAFDIEHIYPSRRMKECPLKNSNNFESLGNKSILEKRINIRASDYRFEDKIRYYLGKLEKREPTKIEDLKLLAESLTDFTEVDIENRTQQIINSFVSYLDQNSLISY